MDRGRRRAPVLCHWSTRKRPRLSPGPWINSRSGGSASAAKPIVDAELHEVDLLIDVMVEAVAAAKRHRAELTVVIAEAHVVVLELARPVVAEGIFQTAADH